MTLDTNPEDVWDGEPEATTNRPPSAHRVRMWLQRPYAWRIVLLSFVLWLLLLPTGWLVVAAMNQTGAPASNVMEDIERTIRVFTFVSLPLIAFVCAVLLYSLFGWKRVKSEEPPADESPAVRTNTVGVVMWTAVTSVLALFLVSYGLVELAAMTQDSYGAIPANDQPDDEEPLIVNVTGQQWVWTFEYPQYDGIVSETLYLTNDRPAYFNVTSKDVIHNFWAVELGVKVDANPGAITQTGVTPNKIGTFNVRCAELCGMHHAYMETQIQVVDADAFASWAREMGGGRTS